MGSEYLYFFKNKNPHGMLQLTVVVMSIQKSDHGLAIRLLRNGQFIDIVTEDASVLKQFLSYRCL